MKLMAVLAWTAAIAASPVCAQAVYRCGSTYSHVPCAPDAKAVPLSGAGAPDQPAQSTRGPAACIAQAPRLFRFPDPDSTRVGAVAKRPAEVIQYAGQPIAARQYAIALNTKNRSGAYDGERVYLCFLSEDEARVLKLEALPTSAEMRMVPRRPGEDNGIADTRRIVDETQRMVDAERELTGRQAPAATSKEARAYQEDRAKRIAAREAGLQSAAQSAGDRARAIQTENYDPKRCNAIRDNMAARTRRDPIGARGSTEMMEMRGKENLYCGPSM